MRKWRRPIRTKKSLCHFLCLIVVSGTFYSQKWLNNSNFWAFFLIKYFPKINTESSPKIERADPLGTESARHVDDKGSYSSQWMRFIHLCLCADHVIYFMILFISDSIRKKNLRSFEVGIDHVMASVLINAICDWSLEFPYMIVKSVWGLVLVQARCRLPD